MNHAPTLDKMNDEGGRGGGFPQFSTTFLPVWNVALLPGQRFHKAEARVKVFAVNLDAGTGVLSGKSDL